MNLNDPINTLKGIGPKKEKIFQSFGINTIEDLLYFFPRSYQDRRTLSRIKNAPLGKQVLIEAEVLSARLSGNPYKKNTPLNILISDGDNAADVIFFNGRFLKGLFEKGKKYIFYGRLTENFGRRQMLHPEFTLSGSPDDIRGILPVYPQMQGISQKEIRRFQYELRCLYEELDEWIPDEVLKRYRISTLQYALSNLHFPQDGRKTLEGKFRMIFSELLTLESGLMYMSNAGGARKGISFSCRTGDDFASSLTFDLTEGQKNSWKSIREDLEGDAAMNRLLQGDVGSGKTVLAEMAMISAAKAGLQSVIMVPTELLAKQHFESFTRDLGRYGEEISLLTSSVKGSEKKRIIEDIKTGKTKLLIATHAVIEDNVKFNRLGLVITDEQHRFGVRQRQALTGKGKGVNVLVMTATPIPRTLAVILYGDLAVSQIRTMPEGRLPVKTYRARRTERKRVYSFVEKEVSKGRQAYVVAPLIDTSEAIDAVSAEELFDELSDKLKSLRIALIHGAMKQEEKDIIMQSFSEGSIDVLVSTVVIEVGINIKNATVMVVENAERFGLAQLHQLRGRVGRGSGEAYCFLISDSETETASKRMEIMCSTNDGFEIAEANLELRGPGEILGTRQHGIPELEISDLVKNVAVLEQAQEASRSILDTDPALELPRHRGLKNKIKNMFGETVSLNL